MNEYIRKLATLPRVPSKTILDRITNEYYAVLTREGMDLLAVSLSTPGVEHTLSAALAAEFNVNSTRFDAAIDQRYNNHLSGTGGSVLHHNLDGSHTFHGAMQTLREHFPHESGFHLKLAALDHLARDFTTPSGINPLLSPTDFLATKAFLVHDIGVSPSLANDLLNFNATEIGGAFFAAGTLLFRLRREEASRLAAQVGRLATVSWFAGNAVALLVAASVFLRITAGESVEPTRVTLGAMGGASQLLLAHALLPALPLSVAFILGATACAVGRLTFTGSYDLAMEMERVFTVQFPRYRSYLSTL